MNDIMEIKKKKTKKKLFIKKFLNLDGYHSTASVLASFNYQKSRDRIKILDCGSRVSILMQRRFIDAFLLFFKKSKEAIINNNECDFGEFVYNEYEEYTLRFNICGNTFYLTINKLNSSRIQLINKTKSKADKENALFKISTLIEVFEACKVFLDDLHQYTLSTLNPDQVKFLQNETNALNVT